MFIKSLYTIFGGLHKESLQREVENFQEQERKLWKLLKSFPKKKKCKDSFNLEHLWSLVIFPKNVKLQSRPLKTLLVLIMHNTHHPKSQIILIRKCRRRSETYIDVFCFTHFPQSNKT